ncbi:MAG: polyprenyl synthetase [Deltaproteobacteria bacterium RBG_16_50_11]|nr:MAG: polyprenyl synthetase [Deltaproteobacteria bacterium RBG_16_50_11]
MDIRGYLGEKKAILEEALQRYFPQEMEYPTPLYRAIRYSLFAGGKRIRPILAMASFQAAGGTGDGILPFACALEMIHTYSLIHDDLPAMDNDDYRRGQLTCHKVFGEAMGVLAGDALLTEAFKLMTNRPEPARPWPEEGVILDLVNEVAQAAGLFGMVGGQALDIESEGKEVDLPTLQYIHTHKTGALILVSVRVGVKLGGGNGEMLRSFSRFGERAGLAFQIVDDILNVEGKPEHLGKRTGSDLSRKKATYPALLGMEETKRRAEELVELAVEALSPIGSGADPLREIARFILSRGH